METKINVAEILESKSQGTKLYSLTYGDCFYQEYTGDFGIECQSQNGVQFNLDEYGKYCIDGECVIKDSVGGGHLLNFLGSILSVYKFKVVGNKYDKEK